MLRQTLCIALAGAMTAGVANAQEQNYSDTGFGPEQGDYEAIITAGGQNNKNFDAGSFSVNGQLGYYLSDELEAFVRQQIAYSDGPAGSTAGYATDIGVDYHFDLGAFRPFVGASIGYSYGGAVNDTFEAGPEAGLKYYVKDDTFLYVRATYAFLFENGGDIDNGFEDGRFNYVAGIGFNF